MHPRQRRPQTGEAQAGEASCRRASQASCVNNPRLGLLPPSQVREMVEIITKEFILMGGTVDVVSTAPTP